MKTKNLFFMLLIAAAFAQANAQPHPRSSTRTHITADSMKTRRQNMEKATEDKILERIEESRLEEEKARQEKIQSLNFSAHQEEATQ